MLQIILIAIKFIAKTLSKIATKNNYIKLFKYFMNYKIIFILYKPLKYILTNIIYFIKLTSAIITIFSLLNLVVIYYDVNLLNEVNNYIIKLINYIKNILSDWFPNEQENIPEPNILFSFIPIVSEISPENNDSILKEFFQLKKEAKIVEKASEINHGYWIIPLMIIGGIALCYWNPQTNIQDYINPILNKIEDNIPENSPQLCIGLTVIYKFVTASFSHILCYNTSFFPDDGPNPDSISSGNNLESLNQVESVTDKGEFIPIGLLTESEREEVKKYFKKSKEDLQSTEEYLAEIDRKI